MGGGRWGKEETGGRRVRPTEERAAKGICDGSQVKARTNGFGGRRTKRVERGDGKKGGEDVQMAGPFATDVGRRSGGRIYGKKFGNESESENKLLSAKRKPRRD